MKRSPIKRPQDGERGRPILFSSPMVRATLAGRKTQTRRVITPRPTVEVNWHGDGVHREPDRWLLDGRGNWMALWGDVPADKLIRCPYGAPGDRLWVKEAIARVGDGGSVYVADSAPTVADAWPWKLQTLPGMFCPKGLSRITLEVTDVRVQRVQDISEADAVAEGVEPLQMDAGSFLPSFEGLWDSINADRGFGWRSNHWVWCVSFRRVTP